MYILQTLQTLQRINKYFRCYSTNSIQCQPTTRTKTNCLFYTPLDAISILLVLLIFLFFFLFIFLFQINEMVLLVHLNIQTFLVLHIYNFNKYFYIQIDCCRFVSIVCVHHQHLQIEPLTMHLVLEII